MFDLRLHGAVTVLVTTVAAFLAYNAGRLNEACHLFAERMLAPEMVQTEAKKSYVTFEPLGVILAIEPWNFPFWQVFRFAAPALMAGNAGLLKHSSNVPRCALQIEEVFVKAGFPADVFRTLMIGSGKVDAVIEHPAVKAVTLTGSDIAGRKVAAKAGPGERRQSPSTAIVAARSSVSAAPSGCPETRSRGSVASTKPSSRLPESPMKMRAGGAL